jgi:diaminohydroxyphosphoribosylaminopyrimidine deaminase/5-amino-6-(5-phosphoribosylamino)uracil reductase
VVTAQDRRFMDRALALAARGRGSTSPNPLVGAVVASPDGTVVGSGFHRRAGEAHAEVHALDAAGTAARGATLYCTLEPCSHTGRTGPCVERIVAAGIARVVASVEDPNPLVRGSGFGFLREHGVQVDVGEGHDAARMLNAPFFTYITRRRPFVVMKIAISLDGRIGKVGEPTRLTSAASDAKVQLLRSEVDAIAIGSETMIVDDPLLTVRQVWRRRPLTRVIFDRRLRTSPSARVWSTLAAGPVIIVTREATLAAEPEKTRRLADAGAIFEAADRLETAMERLAARGVVMMLLEGGAAMHRAAWTGGFVDRVQMFVTPTFLGDGGVPWLPDSCFTVGSLTGLRVEPCGDDTFIEGDVHRPD